MIFEDDITKFPYPLLSVTGVTLQGLGGDRNYANFIVRNNIRNALVFMDVSPDSMETVEAYCTACTFEPERNNTIIPIPCIEFAFLRAFVGYAVPESACLLQFRDYRELSHNYRGRLLRKFKTFEQCCKSVIHALSSCVRDGTYVNNDCICHQHNNTLCSDLTVSNKGFKLLYALPANDNFSAEKLLNCKKSALACYYEMGSAFVKSGIIDYVPKLEPVQHVEFNF